MSIKIPICERPIKVLDCRYLDLSVVSDVESDTAKYHGTEERTHGASCTLPLFSGENFNDWQNLIILENTWKATYLLLGLSHIYNSSCSSMQTSNRRTRQSTRRNLEFFYVEAQNWMRRELHESGLTSFPFAADCASIRLIYCAGKAKLALRRINKCKWLTISNLRHDSSTLKFGFSRI